MAAERTRLDLERYPRGSPRPWSYADANNNAFFTMLRETVLLARATRYDLDGVEYYCMDPRQYRCSAFWHRHGTQPCGNYTPGNSASYSPLEALTTTEFYLISYTESTDFRGPLVVIPDRCLSPFLHDS